MKDSTTEDFAKTMGELRKEVNSIKFRIMMLSIDMKSAALLQESSKEKSDALLKDLDTMSGKYKRLLKDVKSKTYEKE